MAIDINTVSIVGSGFLGSQIASRVVVNGFRVRLFDTNPKALADARNTVEFYIDARCGASGDDPAVMKALVSAHDDLAAAVGEADLVIEAVTEDVGVKRDVFAAVEAAAPPHAIIATNSSSIPISRIETKVRDRTRVLNMHFTSPIDQLYYVELMRGAETTDAVIETSASFIERIGCLPLICMKESIGFVFNRVWHAARRDALNAWAGGYADYRDIDRAWMLFSKMPLGPFGIMDFIGLDVVWQVQMTYFEETGDEHFRPPQALKDMVDRGELGRKSGKGFYSWPAPECADPGFLKPKVKKQGTGPP